MQGPLLPELGLAQDWSTPEGQQLIQLMFSEVLPPIAS